MPTAILVDDMPQALEVLKADLKEKCPQVSIIGTADSVVNAAKLLRKGEPDLLFLDIMLGDGTGFDLLEIFPDISSKIIFVTAYEEHAIKAFRFSAIDYLLKPINPDDLEKAVKRAEDTLNVASSKESINILTEAIKDPDSLPKRISLSTQEKIAVVEIKNIIRCESDGNNTMFTFNNGERLFVTRTLKQFDQMFKEHTFIRTHQSHLINTEYIQEYVRRDGGYIKMKNGDIIPVSVRKKSTVIEMLDNL